MKNIGYWVPVEKGDEKLVYIIAHQDRAAAGNSWAAFGADPEWHAVVKESEKNGKLVARIDSVYLASTDYSPIK
jgi:uncharacterized protein (UPF0128 family)